MNQKIKESIIDTIRFDLWQKLIRDEEKVYHKTIEIYNYGILVDEELITTLLNEKNAEDFHRPDLLIFFRGEGFSIYIEDTSINEFGEHEDPNATHIIVSSKGKINCINRRNTTTENYFFGELSNALASMI